MGLHDKFGRHFAGVFKARPRTATYARVGQNKNTVKQVSPRIVFTLRNHRGWTIEPASQGHLPEGDVPPNPRLRRNIIEFAVVWAPAWPIVVYAFLSVVDNAQVWTFVELYALLFGLGSLLWIFSCGAIYYALFDMAEARRPIARSIREFIEFLFSLLRILRHD